MIKRNYILNIPVIIRNLMPPVLRLKQAFSWVTVEGWNWVTADGNTWGNGDNSIHIGWLEALLAPVSSFNAAFQEYVLSVRTQTSFTGQVISLEHLLNNLFDPISRRIYIEDGTIIPIVYLYTKVDDNFFYLYNKADSQTNLYLYNRSELANASDFIIHLPWIDTPGIVKKIIASWVNKYKQAGKRYTIQDNPTGVPYN